MALGKNGMVVKGGWEAEARYRILGEITAVYAPSKITIEVSAWRTARGVAQPSPPSLPLLEKPETGKDALPTHYPLPPAIKAILISSYSFSGEAQQILDDSVLVFPKKPFTRTRLMSAIQEALAIGETEGVQV